MKIRYTLCNVMYPSVYALRWETKRVSNNDDAQMRLNLNESILHPESVLSLRFQVYIMQGAMGVFCK